MIYHECTDEEFEELMRQRFGNDSRASPKKHSNLGRFKSSRYNNRVNNYINISEYRLENGSKAFKLVYMGNCRVKGLESNTGQDRLNYEGEKGYNNISKLDESISRAKKNIYDLAMCNEWEYFFTGTLNPALYDRSDLKVFHKDFTQFIRNQNRLHGLNIKFLIIPELHDDCESWHFHGFLSGIPYDQLYKFSLSDNLPYKILERIKQGISVYDWTKYHKKFGFCDLEPIQDKISVSCYCTKYITKDLLKSVKDVGAHTYYHSRGLKKPINTFTGTLQNNELINMFNKIEWDSKNDYCSTAWISEKLVNYIIERGTSLYE